MPSPFARTAPALIGMGYSPLPVAPRCEPLFDGHWPPQGKEPGRLDLRSDGEEVWVRLKGWQTFCKRQAHPSIVAHWSRMEDAGVCIATGFGGLVAIDIDDDSLVDPILAAIPAVVVAKRGRKGLTAFYRSAEPLPSRNYRTSERRGLLDFLVDGKQTVLPPTMHPDIGRPYEWITERTLLNTPLEDLPVFTSEHRAKMEEVLRHFGWDAPEPARSHRETVERSSRDVSDDMLWHDDVNAVALANLSAWVPDLGLPKTRPNGTGYRAVASWRGSGSGRADARRSANLSFHPTGIVDFGSGEPYTPIRVVAKARGIPFQASATWLHQRLGLPDEHLILLNASRAAPPPTYPDRTVSLADATMELRGILDDFEPQMKTWRIYRNQSRLVPPLIHRKPSVWGVRIEAGGGKTHEATEKLTTWTKRGWKLAYVVPRIDLAERVARALAERDISVQVYRGREQGDPAIPGKTMCQNLPAAQTALALGLSVRPAVCERRIEEKVVRCRFADICGHERQREAKPDVWIITAASLVYERPDFIPELDGLVIDERFHDNAIGEAAAIDTAELWRAMIEFCSDEEHDFLLDMRAKLRAVAEDNSAGPLCRAVLDKHRIFPRDALRAATLEQRRVRPKVLRPDMREPEMKTVAYRHAASNRLARDIGTLWEEIASFLTFDHQHSGRVALAGSTFTVTPLRSVHPSWFAPVVALDATLPSSEVLDAAVFGDEVHGVASTTAIKSDIAIKWPDHVRVRQIVGAPMTMGKLGLGEKATPKPRNEKDIARFIRQRAALIAPALLGVISYMDLEERLASKLPENVRWMHFGATSGMNDFETVAGLVVIGRWWLAPDKVEARASVFAGYPVKPVGEFYRRRTGGVRMTEGPIVPVAVECHPDVFAEAVRWTVTEAELLQAIGRLRPHRRTEPCFLDIVGDVVLPLTVDEVVQWDDIRPSAVADMLAQGVVLTNVADAMKASGLTKWEAEKLGGLPGFSNKESYYRNRGLLALRTFRYRKAGPGQKAYEGRYLPSILPGGEVALRGWLESRLGPLAMLEVERVQSSSIFAKINRESVDWLQLANILSPSLRSIDAHFDDTEQET